ncbi:hypothetical protein B0H67DRAFT_571715 [Lasiosphaeris hirsuta]|uniref:Uncharacterized protein n=1 Tax=Lasiosphaeris hirsuta TaxID=260670 RepID=A0AA40B197_9PEZI|nr:hypothetical protein B0H67DRAFT_571715 [Lasiosphaeris hirsuta]
MRIPSAMSRPFGGRRDRASPWRNFNQESSQEALAFNHHISTPTAYDSRPNPFESPYENYAQHDRIQTTSTFGNELEQRRSYPSIPAQGFTRRFVWAGVVRWLTGALFSALYYIAIWLYSGRTLSMDQKSTFDALVVAISIALGLNLAGSLKETAIHMRWWFLGKGYTIVDEIELHSLMSLAGVLWRSPQPAVKTVCALWIVLNLALQAAISALGLTYKGDPGIQDIYVTSNPNDMVAIPDMSKFARPGRFNDGEGPQSYAAHILGDIGGSYNYSTLPPEPLTNQPVAKYPFSLWDQTDHWEYVYVNSAPSVVFGAFNFLSVHTNASVTASAVCATPPYDLATNTTTQVVTIRHATNNRTVAFPLIAMGVESIYYLTAPQLNIQTASTGACGPGCSTVHALEPMAGPPAPDSFVHPSSAVFYYECNVTVTDPTGRLAEAEAAVAAQAIALSGQITSTTPAAQYYAPPDGARAEYTSYPFGLQFGEAQNNSAVGMGHMMAKFAAGVVAAAAQTNPRVLVPGAQPRQGVRLVLELPAAFAAVLCAASGVQAGLMVLAAWLVGRVDVARLGGRGREMDLRTKRTLDIYSN